MISVEFSNRDLIIDHKVIGFENNIHEVKIINDVILVLLNIPVGDNTLDNLYGVNFNGDILWRIKEPSSELAGSLRFPYVGISLNKNKMGVVDFYGRRFFVDEKNGEILGKDIVK